MQKALNIGAVALFFCSSLYLFSADDSDPLRRCLIAVREKDDAAFERSYNPVFLSDRMLVKYLEGGTLNCVPITLAHIVASSGTGEMLDIMVQRGLDIHLQQEVLVRAEYEDAREGVGCMIRTKYGFTGVVPTPLLLDVAARAGNISTVQKLIELGANPYRVTIDSSMSWREIFLKEFISDRFGKTPVDSALLCRSAIADDPEKVAIYDHIIRLLRDAQWKKNVEDFSSCEIL